ncbi:MAG: flagellar biosynthesis protein FlgJ [Aquificae bacterium]|nr:flagellar biosynthesis protein FlgJ [Aquificota bacterium]
MNKINQTTPYWDVKNLKNIKTAQEASQTFEAFFIKTLLKEFRKTIPEGLFNTSFSSKMYLDLFDMQIAQTISQTDQLGIKEHILTGLNQINASKIYRQK